MNLRDLHYLVSLAEYCHFGKAAAACFVSQPALSMQIKKLENYLEVQLLERNRKGVLLTDSGKVISEHAKIILHQVTIIQETAKQQKNPLSGELKLGIIPTSAPYLLPYIIPKLAKIFPKIHFFLVEEKTAVLLEKLKNAQLDAVILALPITEPNLITSTLFEEEFLLAIPHEHELAQKKKLKLSDLTHKALLLLEEGHCMREQILAICHHADAIETKGFRATSLETLRYMAATNNGITLIPRMACRNDDNLKYLPFTNPKPKRTIGLVWRSSTAKKILLQKLSQQIKMLMQKPSA